MKTFGTIEPNDHLISKYYTHAAITWELVSSSFGMEILIPSESAELSGSITINRASKNSTTLNVDTNVHEDSLYHSVKHLFYNNNVFLSGSVITTSSLAKITDDLFVISIGQNLYGDRVRVGSFAVSIHPSSASIQDDVYGNLIVSQSGTGSYVGNIFYNMGIAVINRITGSLVPQINNQGLSLVSSSRVSVTYQSDVNVEQHEIAIRVKPNEFNFSPFNPSIFSGYTTTGSVTQSFNDLNIPTSGSNNTWAFYKLMGAELVKPYITTIGLYNEQYELLAVAKLSTAIQRTFNTEQIFIIRFDTE